MAGDSSAGSGAGAGLSGQAPVCSTATRVGTLPVPRTLSAKAAARLSERDMSGVVRGDSSHAKGTCLEVGVVRRSRRVRKAGSAVTIGYTCQTGNRPYGVGWRSMDL